MPSERPPSGDQPGPSVEKAAWRTRMKRDMAGLDAVAAARSAERAVRRTLELPEMQQAKTVLCCLSFGGELDTWALVDRLLEAGKRVLVPRVKQGDTRLYLHEYPCALETLTFGLRQPPASTPMATAGSVDVAVVLGLAFDRSGIRLGYGGGYFDRFFAARPVTALGLGYDFQLVERLPRYDHDVPMTVVVTESETVRPGAAQSRE